MTYRVLTLLCSVTLFSCSKIETSISVLCEKDNNGDFTVKWEIFPEKDDAIVEIYTSDNDSVFPVVPIKRVNANKYIAIIENAGSLGCSFFKLKVGDTYSNTITNRFHRLDEIINLRDLGGYETYDGKRIRWNKIFRSGEFSKPTKEDIASIEKLNIESIVDFRSRRSQRNREDKINVPNRYELYIESYTNDSIKEEVVWNRFLRGDAIIYMQDIYEEMFVKHSKEYSRFFDILADENNYPLIFHCSLGKDQSGVAAYFLLRALGVPQEQAEDDYMLSNLGILKSKIVIGAEEMTESQQEAFTMLTRTDISYLRYGLACLRKSEGSVENYMENKLGLTKEKTQKIKNILLH